MTRPQASSLPGGMAILAEVPSDLQNILSSEALTFLGDLHRRFDGQRRVLLEERRVLQERILGGEALRGPAERREIRERAWEVAAAPEDLQRRHVEITGPVDRKMVINALSSGADCFMADFEDANSPTWENVVRGQKNLFDAIRRQIDYFDKDRQKQYSLATEPATLLVRPRGWHLQEKHVTVDGEPISASLFDFGLYFFHNARELIKRGSGPYFYLPKLESYREARVWNDVFLFAQERLDIPPGTVRATVLIETIHAALQMEEILYELREHSGGLNAGRWDYIFSVIKTFRGSPRALLPDRDQVTMSVPFMKAYSDLLVQTCHRRGAYAIGGMAAFVPTKDPQTNEVALAAVRRDKERESRAGFDGTWVAHPALVELARGAFQEVLQGQDHQLENRREDVEVGSDELLNFRVPEAEITEEGMRRNINVGIQYIEAWLRGQGAVALFDLMEDAATAEISRSQIWQWIHLKQARLADGRAIDEELYREFVSQEMGAIREQVGPERFNAGRYERARQIFDRVAMDPDFPEFLTLVAYQELP